MPTVDLGDIALFYEDAGHGPPVLLSHGWPDDSSTWNQVANVVVHVVQARCASRDRTQLFSFPPAR